MSTVDGPHSAVVTGAAGGIGLAIARRLMADGWSVVAVDLESGLDGPAREVLGPNARFIEGSVGDEAVHSAALEAALSMAPLRGWVNNAGICPRGTQLHDAPLDLVRQVWETNVVGSFLGSQAAVREFLRSGQPGAIVQISSIHGSRGFLGHPEYDMSKSAVEAMVRNIAVAYGASGIRANCIAPGAIETPMYTAGVRASGDELALRHTPLGRIGQPAEIAGLAAFLLGPDASYLSGQTIGVDGGWSASLAAQGEA